MKNQSSVDVLRRMKDRSEVAFESYQKYQNKLLKNLPDNEEPIEFAKNVSIAAEGKLCEVRSSGLDPFFGGALKTFERR